MDLRRYYQKKVGGIQGVVWTGCCSGYMIWVFLPEVTWSEWYSLRAGWWGHYMIIILDGKGINKGWIGYIKFGEAIEKRDTWRLCWGVGGAKVYWFWGGIEKWST